MKSLISHLLLAGWMLAFGSMACAAEPQDAKEPTETPTTTSTAVESSESPPQTSQTQVLPTVLESNVCPPARSQPVGVEISFDPFCVWWDDIYSDELAFRIELTYEGIPDRYEVFIHAVVPNSTSFLFPTAEWPTLDDSRYFLSRHTASIQIFVVRRGAGALIGASSFTAQ